MTRGGGNDMTRAPAAEARGGGHGLWTIFRWPLLLALLSAAGLLSALIGDGAWDALGWAALTPSLLLCAIGLLRARRGR